MEGGEGQNSLKKCLLEQIIMTFNDKLTCLKFHYARNVVTEVEWIIQLNVGTYVGICSRVHEFLPKFTLHKGSIHTIRQV